jgi:hypothetical protein
MSNISFKIDEFSIGDLIKMLKSKEISLPKIQRGYVWKQGKISDLFDSLYRGFPINTLIMWEVSQEMLAKNNIVRDDITKVKYLLLDGQQRITSLALGFLGELNDVIVTGGRKADKIEKRLMFNLKHKKINDLDSDTPLDELDDRVEILDDKIFALENKAMNQDWIPVTDIYIKDRRDILDEKYGRDFCIHNRDTYRDYEDKIERVKYIATTKIPAIVLSKNLTNEEATNIFRRINSQGSNLSGTDLTLAMLTLKWNDCTEQFDEMLKDALSDYGIDYLMIIRQLSIITTNHCKYDAFEKTKKNEIENAFNSLKIIYKQVCDLLIGFGIENLKLLPSKYPFYLLCYLKQNFGKECEKSKTLEKWFFSFNAFSVYSANSETKLQDHLNLVKSAKNNGKLLDDVLQELITKAHIKAIDASYLEENSTTNSSIFKILYFIQRKNNCKDWNDTNVGLSYRKNWSGYNKEVHHIFPKSLLQKNLVKDDKINDIANLTFITSETNRNISKKEPILYFEEMNLFNDKEKTAGHFLPLDKENLKISNYEEFLKQRRLLLAEAINDFLGLRK